MIDRTSMQRREAERGGILAWLAISFLLISACFVMGGIFLAHSIKVRQSRAGKDVQVETPFGSVHVDASGHAGSGGLAIYPGAKLVRDHDTASVDLSSVFGDSDLRIVAGRWETQDS